ncbi:fimbria/pilus outer membrane usher protein [Type-D symbiont of Plautia stali]|uniref:fimbria/pilus outer membrane usher protein n=1 Tax=Type-D symbiont of Plautia stali TaxID=1560356 RepID=UPI001F1971C4|nr:fimbria/pilus outer membrane usher protein [Type-D symbiont of Plautia stali]
MAADETVFDTQTMKARGVDPKIAEWFSKSPRFMPGHTNVALTVNGSLRNKVRARFDEQGSLCADHDFLREAGILKPPGYDGKAPCFDLRKAWPQAELHLDPGEERVDLVLPQQAVAAPGTTGGNWSHGGLAGMLNYDAQYMGSSGNTTGVNFMQLDSEAGFNVDDWIIRSRQTFTRFNEQQKLQHQAAYAQRSFTEKKKVLQVGQVSLSNSMFGAGQVLGFQIFPETALQGNRGGPGLVEGIADSQSVVEVRQSGALIYSTTVPVGPFRLQGLPLLNTRSDLNVTVTGSNGARRQFIVPASALLLNGIAAAPGLSFGAGKIEQLGSGEEPVVGTVANGWLLTPYTTLNAGLLGSTPYRAGALGMDSQLFDATLLSLQTTVAQDSRHGDTGVSALVIVTKQLTERIGLTANASQQSTGYRELSEALQREEFNYYDRSRNQYGAGVSWSEETLGSLTFSVARGTTFSGDNTSYLRGGWSRQFGRAYIGASLEHNTETRYTNADDRFYLTLNLPFGNGGNLSSYLNSASQTSRAGVRYSQRTSQDRGWSLSSDRDFRNQRTTSGGTVDAVTPVSQLNGSLSQSSDNYTTWSARATGAVIAHSGGVSLSPYRVSDTFGIAKVGDESGVRLDTPSGPTWTDGRGYAVVPSLSGYRRSTIQVDTRSLAKNVDIGNAWQETELARGAIGRVDFDVVRTRRALADIKDAQGHFLPHGASVFDDKGNFITVVGERGSVFIPDVSKSDRFDVQASGVTICSFTLTLPVNAERDGLYEEAAATCR